MAAFAGMKTRPQLDAELDRLARMLPPWLEKLRHPAQFWPQFDALAQEILTDAAADDRVHALQRLHAMLVENGVEADPSKCETAPPFPPASSNAGSR